MAKTLKKREKSDRPLWAPWRIEFIRSGRNGGCFLCGMKSSRSDVNDELVVFRGKNAFVILNRFPYNSGHLMISPYRHIGDISLLTKPELHETIDLAVTAKNVLSSLMHADGFNAGFNLGTAAGAGLEEHIHFHVVPRWIGDTNFMPVLGNTRVVPESLKDTASLIRKEWRKEIG